MRLGGELIREARRRAGMSQRELADALRTTQSVVARWETGLRSPTVETLLKGVRACGFELKMSIVTPDRDHDLLLKQNRRFTPNERLDRMLAKLKGLDDLVRHARPADDLASRGGSKKREVRGLRKSAGASAHVDDSPFGRPDSDPRRLLEVIVKHSVDLVLVGGIASALHGAPFMTADVEVVPSPDSSNANRLAAALQELAAALRSAETPGLVHAEWSGSFLEKALVDFRLLRFETKHGYLDLLHRPAGRRDSQISPGMRSNLTWAHFRFVLPRSKTSSAPSRLRPVLGIWNSCPRFGVSWRSRGPRTDRRLP